MPIARPIQHPIYHQLQRQPVGGTGASAPIPEFPVLRVPVELSPGQAPSGSASWDSPAELQAGDRIVLLVTAGTNSPSITTSGVFTAFTSLFTTLQGVGSVWFYYDSPDGAPLSETFEFLGDNSWVIAAFVFQAGSFDAGELPAAQSGLDEGPNPHPFPAVFFWDGNTFVMCAMAALAGVTPTGYPLLSNNAYGESMNGAPVDVAAAICSGLFTGSEIAPGQFTWASANDAAVFTLGIKGNFT